MRVLRLSILAALLAAPIAAQPLNRVTILDLTALTTPDTDDSLFVHDTTASALKRTTVAGARRWPSSTSLPGTCTVGDEYIDTDATNKVCNCTATNTWTCAISPADTSLAPYGQYDPNKPPASCAVCDEFTNDTPSLTWAWGNQDSSALTVDLDSYYIQGDTAAAELHVRGADTPSAGNTDFTITVAMWLSTTTTVDGCALGVITTGTVATPTALTAAYMVDTTTDGFYFVSMTDYAFSGASQHGSALAFNIDTARLTPIYAQLRYVDASRDFSAWYSRNGLDFQQIGSSTTLSADPPYWFIGAREGGECRFLWARARTDANRNRAGE